MKYNKVLVEKLLNAHIMQVSLETEFPESNEREYMLGIIENAKQYCVDDNTTVERMLEISTKLENSSYEEKVCIILNLVDATPIDASEQLYGKLNSIIELHDDILQRIDNMSFNFNCIYID